MKKLFSSFTKSTLLAVAFFCAMTLVGISAAHAQSETSIDNSLFSTTGPNVLPAGNFQWQNQFGFSNIHYYGSSFTSRSFTFDSRVRFGIGHRAELSLSLNEAKGSVISLNEDKGLYGTLLPSVGAKLLLFEGEGWKPMIAYNTSLGFPILHNQLIEDGSVERAFIVRPTIGLQFRNRLGSRWLLDYSLDLSWVYAGLPLVIPTLQARWLATDRLMLGGGIDEDGWNLSCLYQVSPDLQLSLKGYYSLISEATRGIGDLHAFVGVNWMLRNPHK